MTRDQAKDLAIKQFNELKPEEACQFKPEDYEDIILPPRPGSSGMSELGLLRMREERREAARRKVNYKIP